MQYFNGDTYYGGWIKDPEETYRIMCQLPMPLFRSAAPHLVGNSVGKDVFYWEFEQAILGKILPSQNQGSIGSCVSHGYSRASQDLLLIQIAMGSQEQWLGEVAREPIYGGSRGNIGGQHDYSDGSVGSWAAKWLNEYGIIIYGLDGVGLSGYYDVQRCKQWGHDGVKEPYLTIAKKMPVKTVSCITTPEQCADAIIGGFPVGVCGDTSRDMKRRAGGWCPRTGNQWGHCECERGHGIIKGGSSSPWGGDGAFPLAGDKPAFAEQNSWGDYLGSSNNKFTLASGKEMTLPEGCYLSSYEDRAGDLKQGDSFALSHAIGFPAQDLPKALFKIAGV